MSSQSSIRIVQYEHDWTKRQPIPELGDVWQRVQEIVYHQHVINCHEVKLREQQFNILRQRCLVTPSPFHKGKDSCTESYFTNQWFFYRFSSAEEYWWITAPSDQQLAVLYFPHRNLALCLYAALHPYAFDEFERLRAEVVKPKAAEFSAANRCAVVAGIGQSMHMLWNHLPALQAASNAGLLHRLPVMMLYQPFGPTAEIFPELGPHLKQLPFARVPELNAEYALLPGIGSKTIPRSLQRKVREVATRHADARVLAERERFRAAHTPIFWMTVKPFDRTAHNQIEALATIIEEIERSYPKAGFLLDGVSLPWDFAGNPNYDGFHRDYFQRQMRGTEALMAELIGRLGQDRRASALALTGLSACDEIAWAEIADFYFCHGGTAHHKIGWLHETPGMMYSNSRFMAHYQQLNPLEHHPPVYYLPASLVADDADEACDPEQVLRRGQNFTLLAPTEIAHRLCASYRDSQQASALASSGPAKFE